MANKFTVTILLILILTTPIFSAQNKTIILATTTSVQDSGLLEVIIPLFEKKTGYFVKTIAVGSGQAMALGKRGEADLLLVHSPEEEIKFIKEGYGINRKSFIYNDYLLLGPKSNPAKIIYNENIVEAFKKISKTKSLFISRGDNSGTHIKELYIWSKAGINPNGERWYQETGNGMGQTLIIADEKDGYILSDRGTYLTLKRRLKNLAIIIDKEESLKNVYSLIEVNPDKFKNLNNRGAKLFIEFMTTSKEVKDIIKSFGKKEFGEPIFYLFSQ
ncbi:MAG: substrate-binding domain-containing protein [Proteobacteria bacterium]|nr:substrate-binding domain-containing protein [Pseudomonadota bacterium]